MSAGYKQLPTFHLKFRIRAQKGPERAGGPGTGRDKKRKGKAEWEGRARSPPPLFLRFGLGTNGASPLKA